jgi:putative membrane protein
MVLDDKTRLLHGFLWLSLAALLMGSGWRPADRFTWFLEVSPIFIGTAVLLAIYPYFYFSRLVCWLMWGHAIILMIGGHYTYAEVPLFNWLRDTFHLARNHYDRIGHFMQGFVPALICREVLIRRGVVHRGPWLFFIVLSICLAVSASYELIEWLTSVATGSQADAFLGTQGDPWDTHWDMTMALVGAITSLVLLGRAQDRFIKEIHE